VPQRRPEIGWERRGRAALQTLAVGEAEAVAVKEIAAAPLLIADKLLSSHVLSVRCRWVSHMAEVGPDLVPPPGSDLNNDDAEPILLMSAESEVPQRRQAGLRWFPLCRHAALPVTFRMDM